MAKRGFPFMLVGTLLLVVALMLVIGSWAAMFNVNAQGTAHGFLTALKASYDSHRPIPDGQYVSGAFRVNVTHTTAGSQALLQVEVLENHTGFHVLTATRSADAN